MVTSNTTKALDALSGHAKKNRSSRIEGERQGATANRIPGFPENTTLWAPPGGEGVYVIVSCFEDRNLDLNFNDKDNVYAHDGLHGGKNQQWRIRKAPIEGHTMALEIETLHTGYKDMVLDMRTDGNFNIYANGRHNGKNQRFFIVPRDGNIVSIVSVQDAGRSLDLDPRSKNVYMGATHGERNQLWVLMPKK